MTRDEEIRHDLERQWRKLDGEKTGQHLLNPADFADFLNIIKECAQRKNAQARQRSSAGGIVLRRRSTPPHRHSAQLSVQ